MRSIAHINSERDENSSSGTIASMKSAKRGGHRALPSRGGTTPRQQTHHLTHANVFERRHFLTHQTIVFQKACSGVRDANAYSKQRGIGPGSQEVKKCRGVTMTENRGSQRIKPQ